MKNTLTPGQIWKYFRDIIQGLYYLHEVVGVVHRDIKPQNLLLTKEGIVKISDFGWSIVIESGSNTIENTAGSNYFFAPEICKGESHYGKPGDIWALGVTLYFMIFKEYPFNANANEYKKLYDNIINSEPRFPKEYKDEQAIDLIKKMLIKDPSRRIKLNQIMEHDWVTLFGKFPLTKQIY